MFVRPFALALLIGSLAAAGPAFAQVTNTGSIQILVQDESKLPVPGADVTAESTDGVL